MNWTHVKTGIIHAVVFLFVLVFFSSVFGVSWSETGNNTSAYISIGVIALLVAFLWGFQKITGIRNRYYPLGILIGGGFAIAWQHTGRLSVGLSFLAYGLIVLFLIYVYEKVNGQTIELFSENIIILVVTLIGTPVVLILLAPVLLSLDTVTFILVGLFISLILYPVFHRYMHPFPDSKLDEAYSQEISVPLPFDKTFALCRQAVNYLPSGEVLDNSTGTGNLIILASDSVGRTSRISITVKNLGKKSTNVTLSSVNEFIDREYRIPTNRNEMFVRIIVRYVEEGVEHGLADTSILW